VGSNVVVDAALYVHSTPGVPGVDPGTGWNQEAELVIADGFIAEEPLAGILWVTDGSIEVGLSLYPNMVPLPFLHSGKTSIKFVGAEGTLIISGGGLEVVLKGPATYVEDFK
jgi:hypothetical protein